MKPRVTHALCVSMLVVLVLQAGAEAGLPVLEPVEVRGYQGEEGQGLRLTFKRLEPDPALGLWTPKSEAAHGPRCSRRFSSGQASALMIP
jgi:hypothetical protein